MKVILWAYDFVGFVTISYVFLSVFWVRSCNGLPKRRDHSLSAVRDCLIDAFAYILQIHISWDSKLTPTDTKPSPSIICYTVIFKIWIHMKKISAPKHKQYTWWWPNIGRNMSCFKISMQATYIYIYLKEIVMSMYVKILNINDKADHSDRAVWSMNCPRLLERWDRGFESRSRYGWLYAFILCLCCSVCRWRPCDWLIPRPRITKLKKARAQ
jgi:hypothetical protein